MTHTARTLRRAVEDLVGIRDYASRDSPEAAAALVEDLLAAIESLGRFPRRGARPRNKRLRERRYRFLVCRKYLVFYRIAGRTVRVSRVIYGKRAYASLL